MCARLLPRLAILAILLVWLVPPSALLAQQERLTPEQVQNTIERQVPSEPVIVPGQIIVKMRDDVALSAGALTALGLEPQALPTSGGEFIYRIPVSVTAAMAAGEAQDSTQEVARRLAARDDVEYAQLAYRLYIVGDPIYTPLERATFPAHGRFAPAADDLTPGDPLFGEQWHYFDNGTGANQFAGGINLPQAWNTTTGSRTVRVSVIDTGILPLHEDVEPQNMVAGFDMIADPPTANDGGGRDNDPTDPGDAVGASECPGPPHPPRQSSWHGTHVAGTIGVGRTDNSLGVAGVNWQVSVQSVRVLGKCGGSIVDIADGIRWAAGLTVPGVPANQTPADIINMSLGTPPGIPCSMTPQLQQAIDDAVAQGVLVVVAAGNDAVNVSQVSPASCNNVVTVAAAERDGQLVSRYSNFGAGVDITAPGGDVLKDYDGNGLEDGIGVLSMTGRGYEHYNGTSMAAPHVAGVAALWLANEPNLTAAQLEARLVSTAQPVQCSNPCGAGLVNAAPGTPPPTTVNVSLDPDVTLPVSGQTEAVATVSPNPGAGTSVTFQTADPAIATVQPTVAMTDASGVARATVTGASKGRTDLTATVGTASDSTVVRVPDVATIGAVLLLLLIFTAGILIRRTRAA